MLYKVNSGDLPLASDLNQLVDIFNGNHDIGTITFAPQLNAPAAISNGANASGTALGIGQYQYVVTFVTGYKMTNGTLKITGETTASTTLSVTTTSGNQAVSLTGIPTSGYSTVLARRIYRTAVGGSAFNLLAEIDNNTTTTYTDTIADASLGVALPTANTTGTLFQTLSLTGGIVAGLDSQNSDNHQHTFYGEGWFGDNTNGWMKFTSYGGAAYFQSYSGDKTQAGDLYFSGRQGNAGNNVHFTFNNIDLEGATVNINKPAQVQTGFINVNASSPTFIKFWEVAGYGLSMGYDGTGSGNANKLTFRDSSDTSFADFHPDGTTWLASNLGLAKTSPTYGIHQLGGGHRLQALANPTAPTLGTAGTAGTQSFTYYVVATDRNGNKTMASPSATITTANATLSGTNYVTISWASVSGAVSYDVLKGDTGHSIATGVVGTSLNDTGQATTAYTAPHRNTTADITIDGMLNVNGQGGFIDILQSNFTSLAAAVETTIPWNGAQFNNGIYTCADSGWYLFLPSLFVNQNNSYIYINCYLNGTFNYEVAKYQNTTTITADHVLLGAYLAHLNVGDQVKFTAYSQASCTVNYGHSIVNVMKVQ